MDVKLINSIILEEIWRMEIIIEVFLLLNMVVFYLYRIYSYKIILLLFLNYVS